LKSELSISAIVAAEVKKAVVTEVKQPHVTMVTKKEDSKATMDLLDQATVKPES
jgi:hypothetical protein